MSDPQKPGPQGAPRVDLAAEVEALRAKLAKAEAERDSLLAAPAPVPMEAWVLKVRLMLDSKVFERGDVLPFDPEKPPKGCDGLVEGVHYERARVLRG